MALVVTPSVIIDGTAVAIGADALDAEPVAIRGFSIDWGRSAYHDAEVSPSSLTLHLADVTGEWAGRIRDRQAIGRRVEITWTGTPTAPGTTVGPVVMFRGRIQHATAVPLDMHAADGRRRWEITLTCADRTADFGNSFYNEMVWNRDSMLVRANQILQIGQAGGSGITAVYFWPGYVDTLAAPMDRSSVSGLDLLGEFFQSMGNDAYAYDPHDNVIRQSIRLSQSYDVHLGSFDDHLGAILPVVSDIEVDGVTYPGVSLGGRELIGDPVIEADPATDINRLECSWRDHSTGHENWTTVHDAVAPGDSRRVMSWESWIDDGLAIDPTLANVWARTQEEGRRPRHPDVTTLPRHEFTTERLARWILQTWENTRPAYIAGNLAFHWLMGDATAYSPVVAPIGGTTTYDPEKGWSVTFRVHWIHNQTSPGAPVTWADLKQVSVSSSVPPVPWWWPLLGLPIPDPVPVGQHTPDRDPTWGAPAEAAGYRFAESVFWSDMRHVQDGQITDHLT